MIRTCSHFGTSAAKQGLWLPDSDSAVTMPKRQDLPGLGSPEWRPILHEVYALHSPGKLKNFGRIMTKYCHYEQDLMDEFQVRCGHGALRGNIDNAVLDLQVWSLWK